MRQGADGPHAGRVDAYPDEVLAARAADGDTAAFADLLHRYERPMFALAARISGSRTDAEDIVQLAFINAWRTLPQFRGDAKFSTWMYRIVTNQALTVLRRRRPTEPLPDDDHAMPPAPIERGPESCAQTAALAEALAAALAALPDHLRVVWLLREGEHRSYEEVASIVGVEVSTVRGRIARARAALMQAMAAWR